MGPSTGPSQAKVAATRRAICKAASLAGWGLPEGGPLEPKPVAGVGGVLACWSPL